jgi:hypothetical protein
MLSTSEIFYTRLNSTKEKHSFRLTGMRYFMNIRLEKCSPPINTFLTDSSNNRPTTARMAHENS